MSSALCLIGEHRLVKEMRVRFYRAKQLQEICPSFPLEKELTMGYPCDECCAIEDSPLHVVAMEDIPHSPFCFLYTTSSFQRDPLPNTIDLTIEI
jgi:hypothetical protein